MSWQPTDVVRSEARDALVEDFMAWSARGVRSHFLTEDGRHPLQVALKQLPADRLGFIATTLISDYTQHHPFADPAKILHAAIEVEAGLLIASWDQALWARYRLQAASELVEPLVSAVLSRAAGRQDPWSDDANQQRLRDRLLHLGAELSIDPNLVVLEDLELVRAVRLIEDLE